MEPKADPGAMSEKGRQKGSQHDIKINNLEPNVFISKCQNDNKSFIGMKTVKQ